MKKLMLAAVIIVAPPAYAPAMAQREPPLPEHTCTLNLDGTITCTALTRGECQQLIAYIRVNELIHGLDVVPVSSSCEKIDPPFVGYRAIFELL